MYERANLTLLRGEASRDPTTLYKLYNKYLNTLVIIYKNNDTPLRGYVSLHFFKLRFYLKNFLCKSDSKQIGATAYFTQRSS